MMSPAAATLIAARIAEARERPERGEAESQSDVMLSKRPARKNSNKYDQKLGQSIDQRPQLTLGILPSSTNINKFLVSLPVARAGE